jgi:hypothetical protein
MCCRRLPAARYFRASACHDGGAFLRRRRGGRCPKRQCQQGVRAPDPACGKDRLELVLHLANTSSLSAAGHSWIVTASGASPSFPTFIRNDLSTAHWPKPMGTRADAAWESTPASRARSWAATLKTSAERHRKGGALAAAGRASQRPRRSGRLFPARRPALVPFVGAGRTSGAIRRWAWRRSGSGGCFGASRGKSSACKSTGCRGSSACPGLSRRDWAPRLIRAALLRRKPAAMMGAATVTCSVSSSVKCPSSAVRHKSSQPQRP